MAEAFLQFPKPTTVGNIQVVGESLDIAFKGAIPIADFSLGNRRPSLTAA